MLNILKHSNKLKSYRKIIDCDQEFNRVATANNREFNKQIYSDVLLDIDEVKVIKDRYIETKFGGTDITNLQTGCKAVLLAVYYRDKNIAVNLEECGQNAISKLVSKAYRENLNCTGYIVDIIQIPLVRSQKCMLDDIVYSDMSKMYGEAKFK